MSGLVDYHLLAIRWDGQIIWVDIFLWLLWQKQIIPQCAVRHFETKNFRLVVWPFCTNLHGLKLNFMTTLFYKKNILTNGSCVNDPPISAQKAAKSGYFWQNWLSWSEIPPNARVKQKTCSIICGIPVPAILNHKNSTGSAGGVGEGFHWPINMTQMCDILTVPGSSCRPGGIFMVQNGWYRCPA